MSKTMNVYEIRKVKDGRRVSYIYYSSIDRSIRQAILISHKSKKNIYPTILKKSIKLCGIAFIHTAEFIIEIKRHKVFMGR